MPFESSLSIRESVSGDERPVLGWDESAREKSSPASTGRQSTGSKTSAGNRGSRSHSLISM